MLRQVDINGDWGMRLYVLLESECWMFWVYSYMWVTSQELLTNCFGKGLKELKHQKQRSTEKQKQSR